MSNSWQQKADECAQLALSASSDAERARQLAMEERWRRLYRVERWLDRQVSPFARHASEAETEPIPSKPIAN
jgi:hypothetical protein